MTVCRSDYRALQHHPVTITVTLELRTFIWWITPVSGWFIILVVLYVLILFPTALEKACSSLTFVMYSAVSQVTAPDCTSVWRSKHGLPIIKPIIVCEKLWTTGYNSSFCLPHCTIQPCALKMKHKSAIGSLNEMITRVKVKAQTPRQKPLFF